MSETDYMFPTSQKEVKALGWDYIDVILFTGDAFVDHPLSARPASHAGFSISATGSLSFRSLTGGTTFGISRN